jgi:hypothetical protein
MKNGPVLGEQASSSETVHYNTTVATFKWALSSTPAIW